MRGHKPGGPRLLSRLGRGVLPFGSQQHTASRLRRPKSTGMRVQRRALDLPFAKKSAPPAERMGVRSATLCLGARGSLGPTDAGKGGRSRRGAGTRPGATPRRIPPITRSRGKGRTWTTWTARGPTQTARSRPSRRKARRPGAATSRSSLATRPARARPTPCSGRRTRPSAAASTWLPATSSPTPAPPPPRSSVASRSSRPSASRWPAPPCSSSTSMPPSSGRPSSSSWTSSPTPTRRAAATRSATRT